MKQPELEICVYSVESAVAAQEAGATRVELCAGFAESGLTPGAGTIQLARKLLTTTQLYVMIRPRGGDFCYSDAEFEAMCLDIDFAKSAGADGVVIGILLPDGNVDIARTKVLVGRAAPMGVTFHRAIDVTADPLQAIDDIIAAGCVRVLTSGQRPTAEEGIEVISQLVKHAKGRIDVMAGSGVNPENAQLFINAGVQALHFSAKMLKKSPMTYQHPFVTTLSCPSIPDDEILTTNKTAIQKVVKIINKTMQ
ncbi:copper homeostasis protein cutC [Candidatus Symbiothrix dinenymphae]|nr:copper homeostasis protein cutC [Candidatus Symbiothrix dinenymphae]